MRRALALFAVLAACSTTAAGDDTGGASTGPATAADPTAALTMVPTTSDPGSSGTDDATTDPGETGTTGDAGAIDYTEPGAFPVGNTRFTLAVGERELLVEVWYPADAAAAAAAEQGHPIAEFVPEGPDRATFEGLLADLSPAGQIGTRLQTRSALDATPAAGGPWPLIALSHCHNCVRFSLFSVAEHLASHGFVVAAPDHAGNTLFDELAGDSADLGEEFLVVRRGDLGAVVDALLAADDPAVPTWLKGQADADRVGALGHSFGAATAGRLAQEDPRVRAALPIAAPIENPIFPGNKLAQITAPLLAILAEEDNSIQKIGNNLIVSNHEMANLPSRLVRVADAGHWNFTDICGLVDGFAAGCGEGERQSEPGVAFTYLDIEVGRSIARAYALAFFDRYLRDNPAAATFLDAPWPADVVTVDVRE